MSLFACFGGRRKRVRETRTVDYWDCSNLGLTDLPKEVLQYRRTLRQLTLTCNNIKDVPKALFTFELLTELDLSENVILFLPPSIRALRSLTSLNISKNSLSTVPNAIEECQDLLHLDISANSLGSLPDSLTELRQLRTLSLNDCQLEELPPNIGKLSKLEVLELRENLLNSLPQSICHLTLLEKLDLGVNEMESVAAVIGTLESLSELWLDGNLLNTLPDEIGSLRNLKFLEVSENQLMFLPLSISMLASLQDLHLSDNLLTLLPETMCELRNLRLLRVERNRLTALPQTIAGWSNLVELSVSQNLLEEIPVGIGALRRLENLNLDENGLISLPPSLGGLSRLNIFSVRGNNLTELPSEIGQLESLSVLNVVGNRLQFLPYSVTSLTNLTAVWIAENQSRPLLDLQLTRSGDGQKMITCILLPQHSSESPFSNHSESPLPQHKPHPTAVNFDPKVQDRKSNLTRDPTPYPKELHIKALQWRAAREEAAFGVAPDRAEITSDVTLRSSSRARSLHRPYSLIRAMSDPIDQDLSTSPPHSHSGSHRRDHSRERREYSRSPRSLHSPSAVAPVIRGGLERRGERPKSGSFSPSPPPLSLPCNAYPPEHHTEGYPVRMQTNGKRPPMTIHHSPVPLSPTQMSPGDDLHTALIANSNSSNGNWHSAIPAVKASTFPAQTGWYASISPPTGSQGYLRSNAQGQSEASTLSCSDVPNPRISSSVESGFDADVELDPALHWYMMDNSLKQNGQQEHGRRRYASDSSARTYMMAASQRDRSGSSGDYDHLRHNGVPARKPYPKYGHISSPLANDGSHTHHQKASRSFDSTELYAQQPTTKPGSQLAKAKVPQQVSYTAGAKGKNNGHSRSRSQPEELVDSIPTAAALSAMGSRSPSHHTSYSATTNCPSQKPHRPNESRDTFSPTQNRMLASLHEHCLSLPDEEFTEGSTFQPTPLQRNGSGTKSRQSPSPVPVTPLAIANAKYHHHHHIGCQRHSVGKERGREREGGQIAHQRFPSDSYYTSDDSQGLGAEPNGQSTPKNTSKTCSGPTWGTSQDSGFDSMKRDLLSSPPGTTGNPSNVGTTIKVELTKEPSLGLGIQEAVKPGEQGYYVFKIVEGSPAEQCGQIKLGDKILEINGVEVSSLDLPDIFALLDTCTETQISLTLHREPSMTLL